MEDLMKLKEQEIARLNQIKDLLQQKLSEQTVLVTNLKKELETTKSQVAAAPPPQVLTELSQLRAELTRLGEKVTIIETRVLKKGDSTDKSTGNASKQEKSPAAPISMEEKVDLIWTSLNQFLSKVKVASKMAQKAASENPAAAMAEARDIAPTRPLRPSDILVRRQESEEKAPVEAKETAPVKPPEEKTLPPAEKEEEEETPKESEKIPAAPSKPSDIMKRRQAAEDAEKAVKEEAAAQKGDKGRKPSDVAKTKTAPDIAKEVPKEEPAKEEGKDDAKKGKEPEAAGGNITTVPYPADGSIVCPKCGKQNYQEMQDPSNVVAYAPVKKYGRKFYCKSCRCNWRYKA